jgi:hypothetical protein
MQINHILTTSPKSIGDNILLIVHYGPKPAEEIIGTETLYSERTSMPCYCDLREAISMEKRYFTSALESLS